MAQSFLSVVDAVDSLSYSTDSSFYSLIAHDGVTPIGLVSAEIATYFRQEGNSIITDDAKKSITIKPEYDTIAKRNELFADIAARWRKLPAFNDLLDKGWRNELYTVFNPSQVPYLHLERAFSVLTGVITYGAHLTGYVPADKTSNGKLKLWIPRRSATKPTYPGMLDNTVAGGLGYPHGIWETVVKECYEEAGLPEDFVKTHARSTGVLSYMYVTDDGRVQPEVEYIYDLVFDDETTVVPLPVDGEAEDFKLMEIDEVLQRVRQGEFKGNCALVILDFLIRHGHITPETEPNYHEIVRRSHRRLPFPLR
ncbi:thiamine pyrophosphokinase [Scheffersomyces xylosifermentans]|uniref:thiamine pyrophosphokinase n=1 Tax=Scheffersomyces xylosifermentans TaxID=1304137 RepID=UPI00315DF4DC